MNIRQYEYILAVAELKNFGLAAEKCFITQSTLSTMINKFEAEIGIKIFDRKTKPITITKEGDEVLTQLKIVQKEILVLKETVQSIKGEMVGDVKIAVIPTVAPYILPEFVNDFTAKFPKINFSVSEMITHHIEKQLVNREIEIGILATPLHHKDLIEIPLYQEPFYLYNCSGNTKKHIQTLDEVDFSKFWLLSEGHCLHWQFNSLCDMHRKTDHTNFDFKAGSIESLTRFVKMNKGITLLPKLACLNLPEPEQKKLTKIELNGPTRNIGLVVHRHFTKKRLLNELQHEIIDKIGKLIHSNRL